METVPSCTSLPGWWPRPPGVVAWRARGGRFVMTLMSVCACAAAMSKTVDQVYDLLKKDFEHDQAQMAFIFLNFCILCVILVAACASAHARRARGAL